jgi:hypothetical protein
MGAKFDVKFHGVDSTGKLVTVKPPTGRQFPTLLQATTVDGREVYIPQESQITQTTDVYVTCDNPKCGDGSPLHIFWNQERVAEDDEHLPDQAFRIVTLEFFDGEKKTFCSDKCAISFLQSHIPLRSPREINNIINIANSPKFQKMD